MGSSSRRISGSSASVMPSSSCFWLPCERKPEVSWALSRRPTASRSASVSGAVEALHRGEQVPAAPAVADEGGLDVLVHGEAREDVGALERPAHAEPAEVVGRDPGDVALLEDHAPAVGLEVPGDQVEQRGLARAVGADDGADRALGHREGHAPHRLEAVEALADVAHLKHRPASARAAARASSSAPASPPGKTKSRRTRMLPRMSGQYSVYETICWLSQMQRQRADRGAVEGAHAAQQRHDQHLGGLRPVGEVGEDAAVEDAEEAAGQPGEGAREHEGGQLVAPDVDPDELGALRVLADRGEHPPERASRRCGAGPRSTTATRTRVRK